MNERNPKPSPGTSMTIYKCPIADCELGSCTKLSAFKVHTKRKHPVILFWNFSIFGLQNSALQRESPVYVPGMWFCIELQMQINSRSCKGLN